MAKGNIKVHSENIFPIIKKFLYSEHEIFIRELVSNAVDACQKLQTLSKSGDTKVDISDLKVQVSIDKDKGQIIISDSGIGMTEEEVEKYINQVAFSGAEEFLNKYKDKDPANIIGHFGLGFYSSFMVSKLVTIKTKSHKEDAPAVQWTCDGTTEYTIETIDKKDRGTDIILSLNDDSKEFLEIPRIQTILERYARFLPIPIHFDGKQINKVGPIWVKKPSDLKDEDYKNFYKELYPFNEPPHFWIHLNVDYPFKLTGILYFPKIKQNYEIQKDKINLYCNQVYVTDDVKDIVPEFLMLLHGVIDSPDIPLNVSRSYLQGDPNVKKISKHISKKVADKIEEIFKNERQSYETQWDEIGLFVKYGMIADEKFFERSSQFCLFQNATDNKKFYTIEEYKEATQATQKNKDNKHVILYSSNAEAQESYIKKLEELHHQVVLLDHLIDSSFIQNMEMKWTDVQFKRVDSDLPENIIDSKENNDSALTKEEEKVVKELFGLEVEGSQYKVEIKGLNQDTFPVIATRSEFTRRMKDMAQMGGPAAQMYQNFPDEISLTVNGNHPIYKKILLNPNKDEQRKWVKTLTDMALLTQGAIGGDKLSHFLDRNLELLMK